MLTWHSRRYTRSLPEGMPDDSDKSLVWCGPGDFPQASDSRYKHIIHLDTYPGRGNVYLKYGNISESLTREIPSIGLDMLEVGIYVYCADQTVTRGGEAQRGDGREWHRTFDFRIPVRNPDIWNQPAVRDVLTDTLSFLTDDNYEFSFTQRGDEIPIQTFFDLDAGQSWFEADEVLLYSGGLDSLAGAIEEAVNNGRKTALVSHRPVAKISSRQTRLLSQFKELAQVQDRFLHVPVWGNKDSGLTRDTTQRARSFLYTMLGSVVALMHGLDRIRFYENGIISTNLPFSPQLVGARASRTTHPKALAGFSLLLTNLVGKEFTVENPFMFKTKTDVVGVIKKAGLSELILSSNSCGHVRTTDTRNTHCGVCSQCIERRLATLGNQVAEFDPAERYKTELFLGPLTKPIDRTTVECYVRHAQDLAKMSDTEFFGRFGEAHRCLQHIGPTTSEAANMLYDLHHRHGKQVCSVVEDQIRQNAETIRLKQVPHNSLLGMIIGPVRGKAAEDDSVLQFPTPEGAGWDEVHIEIISDDSARIRVRDITLTYTALDMGFRDRRKRDLPNLQWDLLKKFAKHNGVISWASPEGKKSIYKKVQLLKRTLLGFFQLKGNPIGDYDKVVGYVTRFSIKDCRYGKR